MAVIEIGMGTTYKYCAILPLNLHLCHCFPIHVVLYSHGQEMTIAIDEYQQKLEEMEKRIKTGREVKEKADSQVHVRLQRDISYHSGITCVLLCCCRLKILRNEGLHFLTS